MAKSANRPSGLKSVSGASRDDLEALVTKLVETGVLSEEVVDGELHNIRKITAERAKIASENAQMRLTPEKQEALLGTLKTRFEMNRKLHEKMQWADVENALKQSPDKLWSLRQMETTGGAPDIIGEEEGDFVFGDCSAESPSRRRNLVFDKEAEEFLKRNNPDDVCRGNAADSVKEMGVDLMDEAQYRALQKKFTIDKHNTRSWLKTPASIRKLGFALYGETVFGVVNVFQRHAHDRFISQGWRGVLRVPKA